MCDRCKDTPKRWGGRTTAPVLSSAVWKNRPWLERLTSRPVGSRPKLTVLLSICPGRPGRALAMIENALGTSPEWTLGAQPARPAVSIATATQSDGARRVSDWVQLIRQQFQETPYLCITAEQASKLWGLEPAELEAVLSAFVDAHLLNRTRGGAYTLRLDPAPSPHGTAAGTSSRLAYLG
jgi:hypothetical protein